MYTTIRVVSFVTQGRHSWYSSRPMPPSLLSDALTTRQDLNHTLAKQCAGGVQYGKIMVFLKSPLKWFRWLAIVRRYDKNV
jgi:hypothetical protein